jgi:hypothetical protein
MPSPCASSSKPRPRGSKRAEHVVEEVDVGRDRDRTAVERQPQIDPRLLRLAPNVRAPRRHRFG